MARDYSADFQKILEQLSLEEVRGTETPAADLLALNMSDSKGRRFNANHLRGALRAGEAAGHGSLIVGRRGYPTRFAWSKVPATVVKAASAKTASASKESPKTKSTANAAATNTVTHTLNLRRGVSIQIALPADLTAREAVRLAHWVQALPFE